MDWTEIFQVSQSIQDTLAERGSRYGKFIDHATICQNLKDVVYVAPNYGRLAADQKQAIDVIFDKIARVLNGDPNYVDNWHDIQGYAKLVEDRLVNRGTDTAPGITPCPTCGGCVKTSGGACGRLPKCALCGGAGRRRTTSGLGHLQCDGCGGAGIA
jgi:hypothetical protein